MRRLLALAFIVAACASAIAQEAVDDDGLDEAPERLSVAEAERILALPPPGTEAARPAQVAHWAQRERAAFTLGKSQARLEALRRLVALSQEKDKPNPFLAFLWREEVRYGNQSGALEIGESLVADKRIALPARIAHMGDLGVDYVGHGDVSSARKLLSRADAEMRNVTGESAQPTTLNYMKVATERLRSRILLFDGDTDGANAAVRRALDSSAAELDRARKAAGPGGGNILHDRAIRSRNGAMSNAIHVFLAQGRHREAEAIARQGLQLAVDERTAGGTVGIWHGRIAYALLGERRFAESEAAARKAIEDLLASGAVASSERLQVTQVALLQALLGQKRWAEADTLHQQMREASVDDAAARARVESAALQTFLHLKAGRLDAARERIDNAIRYRERFYGEAHALTLEARAVRAMVLQARGETRQAQDDYEAVLRFIFAPESAFADAQPRGLRGFFLPQALEAYLALAAAEHRRRGELDAGMADRAFRVADRLQSSAVQQALVDGAARVLAGTPELAALVRREQEERVKMRDLLVRINGQLEEEGRLAKAAAAAKRDEAAVAAEKERARLSALEIRKTRLAIVALEKERAETRGELARRFPAYYALVNPKPPALAEVAAALGPGEAFVSILPSDEGTFVWGVAAGGATAFHLAPLTRAQVAAHVEKLHASLDLGERANRATRFEAPESHLLYAQLLAPIWPRLGEPRMVTFAGASELGRIPFAALVTRPIAAPPARPEWLVRATAVNQVASAAAFKALRDGRSRSRPRSAFFGFGDPAFGDPLLPPLPETRDEVLAIAKALGADPVRDTRFGKEATRKAALEAPLADRRVVAFATHGLKPGDLPGLSRPALALAPSGSGDPALLVLDDVLTLRLAADWVVLSACNTASSDGRAQEAFSGLARGFFFAGARSVLATHWAVETVSAQQLVTRAFAWQAANPGATRAESLRQAQLELIDGKAAARFEHPFFWAPYALYGDPAL